MRRHPEVNYININNVSTIYGFKNNTIGTSVIDYDAMNSIHASIMIYFTCLNIVFPLIMNVLVTPFIKKSNSEEDENTKIRFNSGRSLTFIITFSLNLIFLSSFILICDKLKYKDSYVLNSGYEFIERNNILYHSCDYASTIMYNGLIQSSNCVNDIINNNVISICCIEKGDHISGYKYSYFNDKKHVNDVMLFSIYISILCCTYISLFVDYLVYYYKKTQYHKQLNDEKIEI